MNSSEEPGTESFAKTSKPPSTDLSKLPSKDASTDPFEGSSNNPSRDPSKDDIKALDSPTSSIVDDVVNDPFGQTNFDKFFVPGVVGISMTVESVDQSKGGFGQVRFKHGAYPTHEEICHLGNQYALRIIEFARDMVNWDNDNTLAADETDRVQQLFDEFGQQDPSLPPAMVAERLKDLKTRALMVEYIIHWALVTNIVVDGDIEYTLLPPRVVALYRDLDRHCEFAAH